MAKLTLDVVQITDPCPLEFDAMSGTGAVRYCGTCRENVYDLSEMSSVEATELLEMTTGRLCVQYYARADDTVVTKDCAPVRFAAARRAARRTMVGASALIAGLLAFTVGLAGLFTFWRDEKPEWVAAAKDMVSVGQPMLPLPVAQPAPDPERYDHRRGGMRRHPRPTSADPIEF